MTAVTYSNLALGWEPENKRDHFFNRLTFVVVVLAIVLGIAMMSINV